MPSAPVDWRQHVVLAYIEEPPFAQTGPIEGRASGCDIELGLKMLGELGVRRIDLHLTTFEELLPGVEEGRWTISVPLFITPQRARQVAFSRPVWALADGFIVRAHDARRFTSYRAIAQSADARLAVVAGQVQQDSAMRAGMPPERIVAVKTQAAAVAALVDGVVDAYASTAVGNRTYVAAMNRVDVVAIEVPHEGALPLGAFSFSHANDELRTRFDQQLAGYLGGPAHRQHTATYGFSAREIDPVIPTAR